LVQKLGPLAWVHCPRVGAAIWSAEDPMVANRRTLARLSWTLVILVVVSAAVTLLFVFGVLLPPPDATDDFVDQLLFMRTHDQQAFPFVIVGSLATLGVYLMAAMFGVVLRAWATPTPTRDAMSLLLVFGGVIGIGAQLLNIGVGDAARPFYCDCGYRAEEVIGLDRALNVGWSMVNWLSMGAVTLVGVGVALAGRIVEVSSAWRLLSYAIAVAILVAVTIRFVASLVFIEAFDPFQVSDLIVAITSGLLVPIWAILLSRGISEPETQPVPAAV
jgi:hypothetical protein